jgi:hypothetical protein
MEKYHFEFCDENALRKISKDVASASQCQKRIQSSKIAFHSIGIKLISTFMEFSYSNKS